MKLTEIIEIFKRRICNERGTNDAGVVKASRAVHGLS